MKRRLIIYTLVAVAALVASTAAWAHAEVSPGIVAAKHRLLVYFVAERDKWGTVIRDAHIRLE